jgi:hypothetical protein
MRLTAPEEFLKPTPRRGALPAAVGVWTAFLLAEDVEFHIYERDR